jgi:hypothetical protein
VAVDKRYIRSYLRLDEGLQSTNLLQFYKPILVIGPVNHVRAGAAGPGQPVGVALHLRLDHRITVALERGLEVRIDQPFGVPLALLPEPSSMRATHCIFSSRYIAPIVHSF